MEPASLIREKVTQGIALLREFGIDCWITFARETQLNGDPTLAFFVPGHLTWHSAIILTSAGEAIAIVGRYDRAAVEETGGFQQVISYVEGIRTPFLETMGKLNPRTIAVNFSVGSEICDGLTHGMYLTLVDLLSALSMEHRLISAEPLVSAIRQRKSDTELTFIRNAIHVTQVIFDRVAAFMRPGMTEQEIAGFMRKEVEGRGLEFAWDPGTCPSVFTGPDTAEAHYGPTTRTLEPGHILNMDFGVRYNGYCSDMQRTFYILRPGESGAPPEVQKGFDTIVRAIESARQAMRPGLAGREIDAVARSVVTQAGYPEFPHALGHQVGRFSHDGTALLGPTWEKYAAKPLLPLEEKMVFTLEPRLTVPGHGIATVEEMVVMTGTGAEYLSEPQTRLLLIPPPR